MRWSANVTNVVRPRSEARFVLPGERGGKRWDDSETAGGADRVLARYIELVFVFLLTVLGVLMLCSESV